MSSAKHTLAGGALVKVESTYGTDASPSTSTDAVRFFERPEITLGYAYDGNRDVANGSAGRIVQQTPKGRFADITHKVQVRGRGAAYTSSSVTVPDVHALLRACGLDAANTTTGGSEKWDFTPTAVTGTPTSATYWGYAKGEVIKATGCYGSFKITADGIGIPVWEFALKGIAATAVADATLPSLTYTVPTIVPPTATNIAFTLGNFTGGVVRSFTFDLGRSIDNPRQNQNASAGHAGFTPGERAPVLEVVVEKTSLQGSPYHATSAIDEYQLVDNATSGLACSLVVGGTQYNRWKLVMAQAQVTAAEQQGDGPAALVKLTIKPYVTGDQANDDLTVRFD